MLALGPEKEKCFITLTLLIVTWILEPPAPQGGGRCSSSSFRRAAPPKRVPRSLSRRQQPCRAAAACERWRGLSAASSRRRLPLREGAGLGEVQPRQRGERRPVPAPPGLLAAAGPPAPLPPVPFLLSARPGGLPPLQSRTWRPCSCESPAVRLLPPPPPPPLLPPPSPPPPHGAFNGSDLRRPSATAPAPAAARRARGSPRSPSPAHGIRNVFP